MCIQIGSWSFYGVTYLANTVANWESLSPKEFTNRRSGLIYIELKVLIAESVTLDSNEIKLWNVAARSREEHFQSNF